MSDGNIRVQLKLDTAPFKEQMAQLPSMMQRTMRSLAQVIDSSVTPQQLNKVGNRIKSMLASTGTQIADLEARLDIEAPILNKNPNNAEMRKQYDLELGKLEELKSSQQILNMLLEEQKNKLVAVNSEQKDEAINSSMTSFFSSAQKGFNGLLTKVKRFSLALLGVRGVFTIVTKSLSGYLSDNESTATKINNIWVALGTYLGPVIEWIVDIIYKGLAYVNAFIKALTGIDYIAKRNASALSKQASATEAAVKASKTLAGFDEMNTLNDDSSSGSGGGSLANVGAIELPTLTPEELARIQKFADIIKGIWDVCVVLFDLVTGNLQDIHDKGLEPIAAQIADVLKKVGEIMLIVGIVATAIGLLTGNLGLVAVGLGTTGIGGLAVTAGDNIDGMLSSLSEWTDAVNNGLDDTNNSLDKTAEKTETVTDNIKSGTAHCSKSVYDFSEGAINDISKFTDYTSAGIFGLQNRLETANKKALESDQEYFIYKGKLYKSSIDGALQVTENFTEEEQKASDAIADSMTNAATTGGAAMVAAMGKASDATTDLKENAKLTFDKTSSSATTAGGVISRKLTNSVDGVTYSLDKVLKNTALENVGDQATKGREGVENAFSSIPKWFETTFSNAWQAVKNVFSTGGEIFSGIKEGIENTFRTVVNNLINGINRIIAVPFNKINSMLNSIKNISVIGMKPFYNLWGWSPLSVPRIPLLARGGIVVNPTQAVIGEAGREAVLPLENNTGWMDELANKIVGSLNMTGTPVYLEVDGKTLAKTTIQWSKKLGFSSNN